MEHVNWGWPLAFDLFAAGTGAGALMLAVMAGLAKGKKYDSIRLTGAVIAPWPVILGVIFLVVDLGKPQRFWEMILKRGPGLSIEAPYLMLNPGSTMSWGTWLVTLFVILSLLFLLVSIVTIPVSSESKVAKAAGIICLPFALLVATYPGVLVSATSTALWATPLLPIVFIVSALATGVAAVTFVLALLRGAGMLDADSDVVTKLEGMNSKILLFLLIVLAVFVALGFRAPGMQLMVASGLGILFWVGVVILGLLIPLFVGMGKKVRAVSTSVIVSLLVLVGGFCLRYVILLSGQLA